MFDYYDTLITPEEVADMLGCGMNTTYKLLKSGKIKAMRIGRVWKIPKRAVQDAGKRKRTWSWHASEKGGKDSTPKSFHSQSKTALSLKLGEKGRFPDRWTA